MKKLIFTAVSLGICTWLPGAFGAVGSDNGLKVVNNFNYKVAYSRPPVLISAPMYVPSIQPQVEETTGDKARKPSVIRPKVYYPGTSVHDWYAALKYVHTLTSFTSDYNWNGLTPVSLTPFDENWSDKISTETMMGFAVSVGKNYNADWRVELEGGYTGEYSDSADGVKFAISAPYLTFNALYNFAGNNNTGFYIGPGLGMAFPMTEISSEGPGADWFLHGDTTRREFSPMFAAVAGFQWFIEENLALDIGYKFYTFSGTKHERDLNFWYSDPDTAQVTTFTADTGWLTNHGISIGLRYYFQGVQVKRQKEGLKRR